MIGRDRLIQKAPLEEGEFPKNISHCKIYKKCLKNIQNLRSGKTTPSRSLLDPVKYKRNSKYQLKGCFPGTDPNVYNYHILFKLTICTFQI